MLLLRVLTVVFFEAIVGVCGAITERGLGSSPKIRGVRKYENPKVKGIGAGTVERQLSAV
jgi:hypothetical protein